MRTFLFSFLLFSSQLFAQTKRDLYIELGVSVNNFGTTNRLWVDFPSGKIGNIDSLANTKISEIIKENRKKESRITIINFLSENGWTLVSSVFVPELELKGGTVYYYFRKAFVVENK
jgi:hypothetical protein